MKMTSGMIGRQLSKNRFIKHRTTYNFTQQNNLSIAYKNNSNLKSDSSQNRSMSNNKE